MLEPPRTLMSVQAVVPWPGKGVAAARLRSIVSGPDQMLVFSGKSKKGTEPQQIHPVGSSGGDPAASRTQQFGIVDLRGAVRGGSELNTSGPKR